MSQVGTPVRLSEPAGRWVLVVTAVGSVLVLLESTVVNIALPALASGLTTSMSQWPWTVDAFTLASSALILVGGSRFDRFGRRNRPDARRRHHRHRRLPRLAARPVESLGRRHASVACPHLEPIDQPA